MHGVCIMRVNANDVNFYYSASLVNARREANNNKFYFSRHFENEETKSARNSLLSFLVKLH